MVLHRPDDPLLGGVPVGRAPLIVHRPAESTVVLNW
jgi:hypothetical protein